MADREKLIELIVSADISLFGSDKPYAEVYADYLLSHGVTFEKQGSGKPTKKTLTGATRLRESIVQTVAKDLTSTEKKENLYYRTTAPTAELI